MSDIPPLPGQDPNSLLYYAPSYGSYPLSFLQDGILPTGLILNLAATWPSGSYYMPQVAPLGISWTSDLDSKQIGIIFDPDILLSVPSVFIEGITSVCYTGQSTPAIGAYPVTAAALLVSSSSVTKTSASATSGSLSVTAPTGSNVLAMLLGPDCPSSSLTGYDALIDGSITVQSCNFLDLAVQPTQPIQMTQDGKAVADGGKVFVGVPVEITVPVSGSGFPPAESRSTTVTLQAGSQTLSQTISLASIQAAGGTLNVSFSVAFGSEEAGAQTVSVVVDPGNPLNETDISNNTASIQVQVIRPYKLVAYVNGAELSGPQQVPDGGDTYDVNPSDFVYNSTFSGPLGGVLPSQPQTIQLACVNTITGEPVTGCQFQMDQLQQGTESGGHLHTDNRPFILKGTESQFQYDGALHSVDSDGQSLTYWPPIISGDVKVSILGFDNDGKPIQDAPPITFGVMVPGLQGLTAQNFDLKCAQPENINNPYCPPNGYQHINFYNVTPAVNSKMEQIAKDYAKYAPDDPNKLIVTDGSLMRGGLYDLGPKVKATLSYWSPPHKYHRQGTDIDIRRAMSDEVIFKKSVCKASGYPYVEDSLHYHLFFYDYSKGGWIFRLCPHKH